MTSQQPFHDNTAQSRSNNLPKQAKMTSLPFGQSKSIMQVIVRKPDVHFVYRSHKHLGTQQKGCLLSAGTKIHWRAIASWFS